MNNIRETLGNAKMAYTNMDINIDGKKVVQNIFDLLNEDKEEIEKANEIDVKNSNGFKINFEMINKIKHNMKNIEDLYRKVVFMKKNEKNYIEGEQTDNLGTICLVYNGNSYCLLEIVLKAILTHNSIIIASESDYMKSTNELIVILIQRILKAYKINKNLVQILYTKKLDELLSNNVSINKVIAIGDRDFQNKIKQISKVEIISKGYNYFDLYIEDLTNFGFIKEIIKEESNIDIYIKRGLKVPFEDYVEVEDKDEAIAQINFNTSGYSSSIFTDNSQNASEFLREVKTNNISVNSSPLIEESVNIDINEFITKKKMFYPNPLDNSEGKNSFEFPTEKAILEKNKEEKTKLQLEQIEQKNIELNELKKQLSESQNIANKYIDILKKSFLSRLFSGLKREDIEKDKNMLS